MALAWANSRHFGTSLPVSCEMTSEKRLQKFHTDDRSGSASDWLKKISFVVRPITIQNWVVTHFCSHFPGVISRGVTSHCGGVSKCRPFFQVNLALHSPFCISSDSCRIKMLLAKHICTLCKPPLVMHDINVNPVFMVDSWEICCWTSTLPSKPLYRLPFTYMCASSPRSESLPQATLEVGSRVS